MIFVYQILYLVLSYLVASIPFGLLLSKVFAKKDIREFGSKNIGATNVTRILGKKLGALTLLLDGIKGAIMVIIARFYFFEVNNLHLYLVLVSSVAVLGHIFSIYLKYRGGKGVATALACLLALDFSVGMLSLCFWVLAFSAFKTSSISSLVAIFSSIITSSLFEAPTSQIFFCWFLFILIIIKHKDNILRIATGEEKKF